MVLIIILLTQGPVVYSAEKEREKSGNQDRQKKPGRAAADEKERGEERKRGEISRLGTSKREHIEFCVHEGVLR